MDLTGKVDISETILVSIPTKINANITFPSNQILTSQQILVTTTGAQTLDNKTFNNLISNESTMSNMKISDNKIFLSSSKFLDLTMYLVIVNKN